MLSSNDNGLKTSSKNKLATHIEQTDRRGLLHLFHKLSVTQMKTSMAHTMHTLDEATRVKLWFVLLFSHLKQVICRNIHLSLKGVRYQFSTFYQIS